MSTLYRAEGSSLALSGDLTVTGQDAFVLSSIKQSNTDAVVIAEQSNVTIGTTYSNNYAEITADKITTQAAADANEFELKGTINAINGFVFENLPKADAGTAAGGEAATDGFVLLANRAAPKHTYKVTGNATIGDTGVTGTQDYHFVVNGTDAALNVVGNWEIAKVTVTSGDTTEGGLQVTENSSATIGDLDVSAVSQKAVVNGSLTVIDSLKTNATTSVEVANGAEITLGEAILSVDENGDVKSGDGFKGVSLAAGSTANLALSGTISADKVVGVINALTNSAGANGLVDLGDNVTVTGADALASGGNVKWSAIKDSLAGVKDLFTNDTLVINEADAEVKGFYGDVQANGTDPVTVGAGTLVLNGAAESQTDADGNTLLTYNVASDVYTAADVNFSGDGVLTLNASGKIGAVTASASGSGSVNVNAGEDIESEAIGSSTNSVKEVNVHDGATLTLVGTGTNSDGLYTDTLNADGAVYVEAGSAQIGTMNLTGDLVVGDVISDGDFSGADVTLTKASNIKGGNLIAGTLEVQESLTMGNGFAAEDQAVRSVAAVDTLKIDSSKTVDVKNGAILAVTDDLPTSVAELNGLSNYGASSVLYVNKASVFAGTEVSGNLNVGEVASTATGISIGDGSVTVIDGDIERAAGTTTFISNTVNVTGDDAKLVLTNVEVGDTIATTVKIDGTAISTSTDLDKDGAWTGKNLVLANGFQDVVVDGTSLKVDKASDDDSRARYSKLTDGEYALFKDVAAGTVTNDYVSDLMGNVTSYDAQARYFDSAARIILAGGTVQSSMLASRTTSDAIAQRTGVGAVGNLTTVAAQSETGASVWLTPIYANSDSDSYDADHFEYGSDIDLYGAALGVDYTNAAGFTAGVAMNIGSGDADSQGDLCSTSNDFDYFGMALYGAYEVGAFKVAADAGITFLSSDIDQNNYTKMTTDTDSTVTTFGLAGKYTFTVGAVDIAPHVGVRYLHLNVDDYDVDADGYGLLARGDSITADIVQFPVGVTLSSEFAAGNWTLKPAFDLSVIPATGDTDVDSDISFNDRKLSYNTDVMSSCYYGATVGLEAAYGGAALGVGYSYFGSSDEDAHAFMLNARYTF